MEDSTTAMPAEVLGARIRLARQLCGMTQRKLAARLAITNQQMNKLERGRSRPSFERVMEIAALTGQNLAFFDIATDANHGQPTADPASHEIAAILDGLPEREKHAVRKLIRSLAVKYGLISKPGRKSEEHT